MDKIKAFTVRLPHAVVDQIDARAAINKRNRNGEIAYLLEQAIDNSVDRDLQVLKRTEK